MSYEAFKVFLNQHLKWTKRLDYKRVYLIKGFLYRYNTNTKLFEQINRIVLSEAEIKQECDVNEYRHFLACYVDMLGKSIIY